MAYYIAFGVVFAAIVSGIVVLKKYEWSLSDTLKKVQTASSNLYKMKEAAEDIDAVIKEAEKIITAEFREKSPEELVLTALDAIKSKMKDAEVAGTAIEYKGNEARIPVTIKAMSRDYKTIVNNVGYLQSWRFPFFAVESVSIEKSKDKDRAGLSYEIKGALRTLKGL
jgi:ACT domain-containing protein